MENILYIIILYFFKPSLILYFCPDRHLLKEDLGVISFEGLVVYPFFTTLCRYDKLVFRTEPGDHPDHVTSHSVMLHGSVWTPSLFSSGL